MEDQAGGRRGEGASAAVERRRGGKARFAQWRRNGREAGRAPRWGTNADRARRARDLGGSGAGPLAPAVDGSAGRSATPSDAWRLHFVSRTHPTTSTSVLSASSRSSCIRLPHLGPFPSRPPLPSLAGLNASVLSPQCGRFHALTEFDGNQRSCRERLRIHAARRRRDFGAREVSSSSSCSQEDEPEVAGYHLRRSTRQRSMATRRSLEGVTAAAATDPAGPAAAAANAQREPASWSDVSTASDGAGAAAPGAAPDAGGDLAAALDAHRAAANVAATRSVAPKLEDARAAPPLAPVAEASSAGAPGAAASQPAPRVSFSSADGAVALAGADRLRAVLSRLGGAGVAAHGAQSAAARSLIAALRDGIAGAQPGDVQPPAPASAPERFAGLAAFPPLGAPNMRSAARPGAPYASGPFQPVAAQQRSASSLSAPARHCYPPQQAGLLARACTRPSSADPAFGFDLVAADLHGAISASSTLQNDAFGSSAALSDGLASSTPLAGSRSRSASFPDVPSAATTGSDERSPAAPLSPEALGAAAAAAVNASRGSSVTGPSHPAPLLRRAFAPAAQAAASPTATPAWRIRADAAHAPSAEVAPDQDAMLAALIRLVVAASTPAGSPPESPPTRAVDGAWPSTALTAAVPAAAPGAAPADPVGSSSASRDTSIGAAIQTLLVRASRASDAPAHEVSSKPRPAAAPLAEPAPLGQLAFAEALAHRALQDGLAASSSSTPTSLSPSPSACSLWSLVSVFASALAEPTGVPSPFGLAAGAQTEEGPPQVAKNDLPAASGTVLQTAQQDLNAYASLAQQDRGACAPRAAAPVAIVPAPLGAWPGMAATESSDPSSLAPLRRRSGGVLGFRPFPQLSETRSGPWSVAGRGTVAGPSAPRPSRPDPISLVSRSPPRDGPEGAIGSHRPVWPRRPDGI